MKMIVAIVNRDDTSDVCDALRENGFMFTKVSSTGGFLSDGNNTLLIGTEDEKKDEVIKIIKENSETRKVHMPALMHGDRNVFLSFYNTEVTVGGATIFVLNAEEFVKC